jgi:hypothetical protein
MLDARLILSGVKPFEDEGGDRLGPVSLIFDSHLTRPDGERKCERLM